MHAVDRPGRHRLSIAYIIFFGFHMLEVYQAVGIHRWSQIGSLRTFITAPRLLEGARSHKKAGHCSKGD